MAVYCEETHKFHQCDLHVNSSSTGVRHLWQDLLALTHWTYSESSSSLANRLQLRKSACTDLVLSSVKTIFVYEINNKKIKKPISFA